MIVVDVIYDDVFFHTFPVENRTEKWSFLMWFFVMTRLFLVEHDS